MKRLLISILLCLAALSVLANRYVTTGEIIVRAGKDPNSKLLGRIQNNTVVDVTGVSNSWCKINYNGKKAYVQGKYLKHVHTEGWIDMDDPDTIFIIIGSVLVIFATIFRIQNGSSHQLAPGYPKAGSTQLSKANNLVSYWYHCGHCHVSIRNLTEPNTKGCGRAVGHSWINLGEAGDVKYFCKKCSTFVAVRSEPGMEGCLRGEEHDWRKF